MPANEESGPKYFEPQKLFLSYSHRDRRLFQTLHEHLSPLKREGLVLTWSDVELQAGSEIASEIREQLDSAQVIILLISSSFLASEFCYHVEMRHALDKQKAALATVIPVILRPCDWQSSPFANLLALPRDGKPVTTWANRDSAWADVTLSIRRVLANRAGASALGNDASSAITGRPASDAALTVSLHSEGTEWKDVRFVIRNTGGRSFRSLNITFSIPESEGEQADVFQSAGGGDLGLLDQGYAVKIPGPPRAMEFLWERSLKSRPDEREFLNQVQLAIEAMESASSVSHMWLFRFRFTELPTGHWSCQLDLERKISTLCRLILKKTDDSAPMFGGEFFLEPKHK